MSADALTETSRNFYEWARSKILFSIVAGAACVILIGLCSSSAGESNNANEIVQASSTNDDHTIKGLRALSAGYGFASFLFFCSFVIFLAAAVFISPLCCGSNNERKVIRSPQEIDADYTTFGDTVRNPAFTGPQV